ncbi:MAG: hypothetical protein ACRC2T_03310, partial [Thermoguttaceae bacterium]
HRVPENNYTGEETHADTVAALKEIADYAKNKGITVSLRLSHNQQLTSIRSGLNLLNEIDAENVKLAPHVWIAANEGDSELLKNARDKFSFMFLSRPLRDVGGSVWTLYGPLAYKSEKARYSPRITNADRSDVAGETVAAEDLKKVLDYYRANSDLPIIFDAVYRSLDDEYNDIRITEITD